MKGYIIPVRRTVQAARCASSVSTPSLGKPRVRRDLNSPVVACYLQICYRYQSAGCSRRPVDGFFYHRMVSVTSASRRARRYEEDLHNQETIRCQPSRRPLPRRPRPTRPKTPSTARSCGASCHCCCSATSWPTWTASTWASPSCRCSMT
ncbi:hypothetical protein BSLA_03f0545 [Burkholderia stabilis]|nr:hypothetical protein BSLA_03f0545 [Burkholderia stabilis]